jgi:hypothetical protein
MCCGEERGLVVGIFLIGCFTSAVYIDYCFPALLPSIYNISFFSPHLHQEEAGIPWSVVFPAPRDVIWFVVFCVVGIMTLWSFLEAVIVDPGVVPIAFHHSSPKSASLALRLASALHTCPACMVYKPQRAHHCSRCQRCVLKYDHHCPWIGQCVGFFNYKLYLLFVWYTQVFTQVVTLTTGGGVMRVFLNAIGVGPGGDAASTTLTTILRYLSRLPVGSTASAVYDASAPVVITYVLATIFQILTLYLIAKHTVCSRSNMTTVDHVILDNMPEDEREEWRNPFDVGVDGNLESVFGDGMWSEDVRRGRKSIDEARRTGKFRRWLWRLLPIPAYPLQSKWVKESPDAFLPSQEAKSAEAPLDPSSSTRNYLTLGGGAAGGAMRLLANDKYLGIVFPTASQMQHHNNEFV